MSADTTFPAALQRGPLLLDGALGTELERRGVRTPAPLWSAAALRTHAALLAQIHREYVAAGADILVANTFRCNPRALRRGGLHSSGADLCKLAVELARGAAETAARRVWVAASIGPVEDCYRPDLTPSDAALRDEHALLVEWLCAARPDLLWIETIGTLREALAACAAAHAARQPFVISFVMRQDGCLLAGDGLRETLQRIEPFAPLALGVNCIPPSGLTSALAALRAATARPIAAYAHIDNAEPLPGWDFSQRCAAAEYADFARQWLAAGARIVGGCCGTTPAHIAALAQLWSSPAAP